MSRYRQPEASSMAALVLALCLVAVSAFREADPYWLDISEGYDGGASSSESRASSPALDASSGEETDASSETQSNQPPKAVVLCLNPKGQTEGDVEMFGPMIKTILPPNTIIAFIDPSFALMGNAGGMDKMWSAAQNATQLAEAQSSDKLERTQIKTVGRDKSYLTKYFGDGLGGTLSSHLHFLVPWSADDPRFVDAMEVKWGAMEASFDYVLEASCPITGIDRKQENIAITKLLKPGEGKFISLIENYLALPDKAALMAGFQQEKTQKLAPFGNVMGPWETYGVWRSGRAYPSREYEESDR